MMKAYGLQTLPSQILNPALEGRLDKSVSVVAGILEFCHLTMEPFSKETRETSNKALNAINGIHLIPFLMGFLENRDKLPSRTVAAAGTPSMIL